MEAKDFSRRYAELTCTRNKEYSANTNMRRRKKKLTDNIYFQICIICFGTTLKKFYFYFAFIYVCGQDEARRQKQNDKKRIWYNKSSTCRLIAHKKKKRASIENQVNNQI